jgi:hypothetical protein
MTDNTADAVRERIIRDIHDRSITRSQWWRTPGSAFTDEVLAMLRAAFDEGRRAQVERLDRLIDLVEAVRALASEPLADAASGEQRPEP